MSTLIVLRADLEGASNAMLAKRQVVGFLFFGHAVAYRHRAEYAPAVRITA